MLEIAERMCCVPDPMMQRLASYRSRKQRLSRGVTLAWLILKFDGGDVEFPREPLP